MKAAPAPYISNYFRMYEKLAGMTGTAMKNKEFRKIYVDVVIIPTNEPTIERSPWYRTEQANQGCVEEIAERQEKG